eukprot:CAMPEP_0172204618 /NCGR_PEP_ID=MMETSP1050-20130122/32077_1 /TAXON_ID=233186 /ORGANISM="Cryptomonas curvata, Strain CCAP979/52" /LENGTH=682 /DNA_ID=CAMNT_0012883239 /DNA_START=1649 /DNA_END=3697 /DNA_ORIENTATION=-
MEKRVTRQDIAKAAMPTAIINEHAEKMVQMFLGQYISPSKKKYTKLSPQQIASRHEFLNDKGDALYSVDQVRTLLQEQVGGETTETAALQTNSLASPQLPAEASTSTASSSRFAGNDQTAAPTSPSTSIFEASGTPLTIRLRMQPDWTLQEVYRRLTDLCALPAQHSFKLQFEPAGGGADIIADIADVWDVLRDQQASGRWVFRSVTPSTPLQSLPEQPSQESISLTSDHVSRKLSYENLESDTSMLQLTKALRLQQFEQSAKAEIQAAIKVALKPYGEKIGKAGRSHAETFFKALRVIADLTKLLERLNKQAKHRADPATEQQRLHWFIDTILDMLEEDVKERWQGQDDPVQCEANFYTSWLQFRASLFTIIRNVIDFTPDGLMDQLPSLVAPTKCASRSDLWVVIEQVQGAAKTLAEMKSIDATAQIEAATVKYLAASLTPEAVKSISEALALKHRAEASNYYVKMQHPPLTAYPSKCIKAVMLGRDDFEGNWRADWRLSTGKDTPAQTGKGGGAGNPRVEKPASSSDGSAAQRTRVLKRNQQAHVFSYYLKDVTDAGERERQGKNFLANTLLDWKCHKCGVNGHTQEICPLLSKLDPRSIERNPKSFFFELRPPQQILNLSNAVKVMPVMEASLPPSNQLPTTGAAQHGPVQLSSTELDPQEWQAFQAWRTAGGPPLGN